MRILIHIKNKTCNKFYNRFGCVYYLFLTGALKGLVTIVVKK